MNESLENRIRREVITPAFAQYNRAMKRYKQVIKEFRQEFGEDCLFPDWETPDLRDYLVHEIASFSLQIDKIEAKKRKK